MANGAFDKQFDQAKAQSWLNDKEIEFQSVQNTINRMLDVYETLHDDEDSVSLTLKDLATKQQEEWGRAADVCNRISESLQHIIDDMASRIKKSVETIQDLNNSFHL